MADRPADPHSNCIITADGYGTTGIRAEALSEGIKILSSSDKTRQGQAAYFTGSVSDDFGVQAVFSTRDEMNNFSAWMYRYIQSLTSLDTLTGVMTVICASRNFMKVGYPASGVAMEAVNLTTTFRLLMTFTGAMDPVSSFGEGIFSVSPGASKGLLFPIPIAKFPTYKDSESLYDNPAYGTSTAALAMAISTTNSISDPNQTIAGSVVPPVGQ